MRHEHARHRRLVAAVAVVAVLSACADDGVRQPDQDRYREHDREPAGAEVVEPGADRSTTDGQATVESDGPLGTEEVADLAWMREEEQLAHDVYATLGDLWGTRIFENITRSEDEHIALVIDTLDEFGLADPAAGNERGTFTDPDAQTMYDDYVADGSESLEAALAVGALIEELDIADLRAAAEATDDPALEQLYARLERASRNHLRAFVRQLDRLGADYEPTVLEDFDTIVSSPMERGWDDG